MTDNIIELLLHNGLTDFSEQNIMFIEGLEKVLRYSRVNNKPYNIRDFKKIGNLIKITFREHLSIDIQNEIMKLDFRDKHDVHVYDNTLTFVINKPKVGGGYPKSIMKS